MYAGGLLALELAANAVLIDSTSFTFGGRVFHPGLPRELRWFLIGAGIACLLAGTLCARYARRIWRRDKRKLAWGFLIGIPLSSVAGIPIGLLAFGIGTATSKVADAALPSQNYIDLRNDSRATVQVRYCIKQDCATATSVTLLPGESHRYPVPKDDPTPDEWVITGIGSRLRCNLVPTLQPDETGPIDVRVSDADPRVC
jgi:hypothetical protein